MPRASVTDALRTAKQIRASAESLFAREGFAQVALEDVASDAGVTRGAVYHHYRNRAGLFHAVAAHLQSRVAEAVVEAAEQAGADPFRQLSAGSHAFLDAITSVSAARIVLVDAPAALGWDEWRRLDAEHAGAHLSDALTAAGVPEGRREAIAAGLSGAMNELALWVSRSSGASTAREQAHAALDQLLRGVEAG